MQKKEEMWIQVTFVIWNFASSDTDALHYPIPLLAYNLRETGKR